MKSKYISYFNIDKVFKKYEERFLQDIQSVMRHGKVLMGPEIVDFEYKIADYCSRKYAVAVGSCTDALYFALNTLGVKKDDEVLVTGFSFIASATPILRLGAVPVFVDIDSGHFMMDMNDLESKITSNTKAIIAVNLFGQMISHNDILCISKKYNIPIIEDAAQSLGSKYIYSPAGSFGKCSCISFDPTKVISAFGNGGVILTDDKDQYNKVKKLRYHGKNTNTGDFEILGINSRLSTVQAAMLNSQLDMLDSWITRRNLIANIYNRELTKNNNVRIPQTLSTSSHTYHKYVVKVKKRNGLSRYLKKHGVQNMIHYSKAIYEHSVFKNYRYKATNIYNIHKVKDEVISLPIYPEIKDSDIIYICKLINSYYSK